MKRVSLILSICFTALLARMVDSAQPKTNKIMGTLGYVVGTEMTVEATFKGHTKGGSILVTKVNGKDLPSPVGIESNIIGGPNDDKDVACRLRGVEESYVVPLPKEDQGDYEAQGPSGRYFTFIVEKVLSPEGLKIRGQGNQKKATS